MSITTSDQIFKVEAKEYGYCCGSFTPIQAGQSIAMYVPSIMGGIESTGRETINRNGLFANDASCMPSFDSSVNTQKCIYPRLKANMNWLDVITAGGIVPAGTRFMCEFANGCIDFPYFTSQ